MYWSYFCYFLLFALLCWNPTKFPSIMHKHELCFTTLRVASVSQFLFLSRFNICIHAKHDSPLFLQFSANLLLFLVFGKILDIFIHSLRIFLQPLS